MSLINDALKRVKASQQQAPPPDSPHLQLRPVEPPPPARHGVGVLLPVAFGLVALFALLLVWELRKQSDLGTAAPVRAQTLLPDTLAAQPASPPTTQGTTTVHALSWHNKSSSTALTQAGFAGTDPVATVGPEPVTAGQATNAGQVGAAQGSALLASNPATASGTVSNAPGTNNVAPPPPPPLKLQGVVFDPKRPSAVINGRTLFIGDRIREMRLIAITQEAATLVGAGHTNVLSLAE